MKTRLTYLTFFTLLAVAILTMGNSTGARPEHTGAPGEQTCGKVTCHNTPINQGPGTIEIDFNGGKDSYTPGERHTIEVSISSTQSPKNGFEIVALDANENNAGTWNLSNPGETQIEQGMVLTDRFYVTHTSGGNQQSSWSMEWDAPELQPSAVTFYVAVNDANNNGSSSGDRIYTSSATINVGDISAVKDQNILPIRVYPNPTTDYLKFDMELPFGEYQIIGMDGLIHKNGQVGGQNEINVNNLTEGMYILRMENKEEVYLTKFTIL